MKEIIEEEETRLEKFDDWYFDHVPGWFYRLPSRIKDVGYDVKYFFQKIFRKNHTSDRELWNLYGVIIKHMYPKLLAFKKLNRAGYPIGFSEFDDSMGYTNKEEYDKAIADGDMFGGGMEAWNKILDEIIFACEYTLHDEYDKKYKFFYEKWNLEDPHEVKEENRSDSLFGGDFYYNVKLDMEYSKRAQNGFKLLGEYMLSLWD